MNHTRCAFGSKVVSYQQAQSAPVVVSTAAAGKNCCAEPRSGGFTRVREQPVQAGIELRDEHVLGLVGADVVVEDEDALAARDHGGFGPAHDCSSFGRGDSAASEHSPAGSASSRATVRGAPNVRPPSVERAIQIPRGTSMPAT